MRRRTSPDLLIIVFLQNGGNGRNLASAPYFLGNWTRRPTACEISREMPRLCIQFPGNFPGVARLPTPGEFHGGFPWKLDAHPRNFPVIPRLLDFPGNSTGTWPRSRGIPREIDARRVGFETHPIGKLGSDRRYKIHIAIAIGPEPPEKNRTWRRKLGRSRRRKSQSR